MTRFSFSSLRVRLLLLVLVSVVPALGLIHYTASKQREQAAHDAQEDSLKLIRALSAEHERLIESGHQLLVALAKLPQVLKYDSNGCSNLFSDLIGKFKVFTTIAAAKPNGDVFCSGTPGAQPVNFSDRPYFQQVLKMRDFTVSEFIIGRFSKKPIITLSYPSLDARGHVRAVLVIGLNLSWFHRIVAEARLPEGSSVTVIDRKGVILARDPDPENLTGKSAPEASIVKTVLAGREGTTEAAGLDGVPCLYAFTSLRGMPKSGTVYVWAGIPKKQAFADVDRIVAVNLAGLGLVVVLMLAFAWTGSDIFVLRRINVLVNATKRLSAGDLGARAGGSYDKGELGQLARSFDAMAESLERRHQQLKALHEIDVAIASTLDLRTVLDVLLDKIDRFLPYAVTTVRLLNRETGELESFACRNVDEKEWKEMTARSRGGITRMLPENNVPLVIRNVQTDPRSLSSKFVRKYGLVSLLRVPLTAKGEVLGVLSFFTKEEHEFTNEEIEFLTSLAGQAAIAIYNSQFYEEIRAAKEKLEAVNQRLERSLKELSGLYTALTPLGPAESINGIMDGIIERLRAATGADAALIRLRDNSTGNFILATQRGFPDFYLGTTAMTDASSAVAQVFETDEPIIAADIASDPRLTGKVQLKAGLRSCAFLPLKVRNEIRGIIHLASREVGHFDESQEEHLMAIVRQMGIALENRDLFDSLKASRDALEKANKVKDEFLSVMSHELRTPLNVIMGYTGMIKDGMLGEINQKQVEALSKVISRSENLLKMINEILETTSIEAKAVKVESSEVNLREFLDDLRSDSEIPLNEKVRLIWDYSRDLPVVKIDREKLRHILQNLINNAIKFTAEGHVAVTVKYLSGAGVLEFKVADTGVGIPEEALPLIFERFRQVDSSETRRYGGVGMGLYIVKKFTDVLGGTVEVESEPGKGSAFTVRLPVETVEEVERGVTEVRRATG
jgi:signal transduction histidine kinase/HAMP domain-containing protein